MSLRQCLEEEILRVYVRMIYDPFDVAAEKTENFSSQCSKRIAGDKNSFDAPSLHFIILDSIRRQNASWFVGVFNENELRTVSIIDGWVMSESKEFPNSFKAVQ